MYYERITKLRSKMLEKNIDGVLLVGDANRNYMSGFTGDESFSLITKDNAFFITDSRFTEQARLQAVDYESLQYKDSIHSFVGDLVKKLNLKAVGFEEDILTVSEFESYKKNVPCSMVPLDGLVETIRVIKDENEIESIRKAAKIADDAFVHMKSFIRAGMTEREIGLELEFFMKKNGAKGLSFPSIVASGVRSSLPHGEPTDKVVSNGEFLTLDYGCVFEEYCSDMTRTFIVGEPTEKMIKIYDTVLKAQKMALEAIKPGIEAKEVDKVARDFIASNGFGSYFGHGLGHGVGRQIHESPRLSTKSKDILKTGMIVTDEPGIYIPNFGGVRIEDLIVVTKDGYELLSNSPKELTTL